MRSCSRLLAILLVGCGSAESKAKPDAATIVDAVADSPAIPAPDVDQIPWSTVGTGVASKDTQNPLGSSMLVAYAGYGVSLASAEAWATELYRATMRERGVRHIWAVRGPADP